MNSSNYTVKYIYINKDVTDNDNSIIWDKNKFRYLEDKSNGVILHSMLNRFLFYSMVFGYTIYFINIDDRDLYDIEHTVYNYNIEDSSSYYYEIQK